FEIDEDLSRAAVRRPAFRESDEAPSVALFDWFIGNGGVDPSALSCRIPIDSKLHHEAGDHAEKAAAVIVAILYKIVETIGTVRRPIRVHFHLKDSGAGIEFHFIYCRRTFLESRCILQIRLTVRGGYGKHYKKPNFFHRVARSIMTDNTSTGVS